MKNMMFGLGEKVVQAGGKSFRFSDDALAQMEQRHISMSQAQQALSKPKFDYPHKGGIRQGYFDPATNTFVGTSDDFVTTTMQGSRVRPYVERLGWRE